MRRLWATTLLSASFRAALAGSPFVALLAVLTAPLEVRAGETATVPPQFGVGLIGKIADHLPAPNPPEPPPTPPPTGTTAAGKTIVGGAAASDTTSSTIVNVLDVGAWPGIATSQQMLASGQPFTFDFEDGLQGWTLEGWVQRVNTQVLEGEWAIFGDGLAEEGARISIELDLSGVAAIRFDQLYAGTSNFSSVLEFLTVRAVPLAPGTSHSGARRLVPDAMANPGTRIIQFDRLTGLHRIEIEWLRTSCGPRGEFCVNNPDPTRLFGNPPPDSLIGLLDNITLIPIPEPGTLLFVLGGLFALLLRSGCRNVFLGLVAMGALLIAASQQASAASIRAVPDAEPEAGVPFEVDLFLDLRVDEEASVFEGRFDLLGAGSFTLVSLGPTWPPGGAAGGLFDGRLILSLTSNNQGGERRLATVGADTSGPFGIVLAAPTFVQKDVPQTVADIPLETEPGTVLFSFGDISDLLPGPPSPAPPSPPRPSPPPGSGPAGDGVPVPEPATLVLLALGLIGLAISRKRGCA